MKIFIKMFSSTSSWIIFGVIALVAVVVIWKWWNKPKDDSKKNDDAVRAEPQMIRLDLLQLQQRPLQWSLQ